MKPHEEWLFKAGQDLKSARILFHQDEPILDIAIYHTQQCAEKSLKAFLAYHRQPINKTHNLKGLLSQCTQIQTTMDNLFEACITLNPYATLYRYPEGDLMPKINDVKEALKAAEMIHKNVLDLLNGNRN